MIVIYVELKVLNNKQWLIKIMRIIKKWSFIRDKKYLKQWNNLKFYHHLINQISIKIIWIRRNLNYGNN